MMINKKKLAIKLIKMNLLNKVKMYFVFIHIFTINLFITSLLNILFCTFFRDFLGKYTQRKLIQPKSNPLCFTKIKDKDNFELLSDLGNY